MRNLRRAATVPGDDNAVVQSANPTTSVFIDAVEINFLDEDSIRYSEAVLAVRKRADGQ